MKIPDLSKKYKGEGNPMYGKKSWNSGKKINRKKYPNMGHFQEHTEETIQKMSGENHYAWIKDRNIATRNKRHDGEYKQWVKKVKKRDNNVCKLKDKNCSGYNIVHHIKSWSEHPELRYKIKNGITLCQAHHPRGRAEEKRLVPILEGLVSVSGE